MGLRSPGALKVTVNVFATVEVTLTPPALMMEGSAFSALATLLAFDLPDSNQSCPKRERSTTAPQALALLNAADVVAAAEGVLEDRARHEVDLRVVAGRLAERGPLVLFLDDLQWADLDGVDLLLELVAGEDTDPAVLSGMAEFGEP